MFAITTVNVNGIRAAARKGGLEWVKNQLERDAVQVFAMQEVRANEAQTQAALAEAGLDHFHLAQAPSNKPGYAGVLLLSKLPLQNVKVGVGPKEFKDTGRWVQADVSTKLGLVTVASVYVHAGDAEKPVQAEKYGFLDAMTKWFKNANKNESHYVVAGDLNVAHRAEDLKNWKGNLKNAGFLPEERAYFDNWFDKLGVIDTGRKFAGDVAGPYTWWSMRGQAFDTDTGWRIDYLLANPELAAKMQDVRIDRAASYAERWSDHAPVTTVFGAK
jgi:exodeoxyribonuclease III